jgi:hypothetical protein
LQIPLPSSVAVPSPTGAGQTIVATPALLIMMRDQFANYVVQKMLDLTNEEQRRELVGQIRPHTAVLRCALNPYAVYPVNDLQTIFFFF